MRSFFINILIWFAILFGLAALVIATSKEWSWDIRIARGYIVNHAWWGPYTSTWGDLVNMSYLDKVKRFRAEKSYTFAPPADNGRKNINLCIYGDSYVKDVPPEAYANTKAYQYQNRIEEFYYTLDTTCANILIIEFSERFVIEEFGTAQLLNLIKPASEQPHATGDINRPSVPGQTFSIDDLFNPHINQNLEYHLFDYNFLTGIRQLKATLNYELFNRASGDVSISDNGDHLFFKPTVSDGEISIYRPVSNLLLDSLINSLNCIYDRYRKMGFAEVYLSIIPNPATVLQPPGYNRLISLVQNDTRLKMPVIDVYSTFRKSDDPSLLFQAGDTHWNNNGMQIWLSIVNDTLRKESRKKDK